MMSKRLPKQNLFKPAKPIVQAGANEFYKKNNFLLIIALIFSLISSYRSVGQVVAGWNPTTPTSITGYGPSPFTPTTIASNVTVVGLTRGSGIGTANTAAGSAWGGTMSTANVSTSAAAITANQFVTFSIAANSTFKISLSTFDLFYRRSGTGPAAGLLQYAIGAGAFTDITTLSFASTSSSGAALSQVSLAGISALQNVVSGNTINFRIVLYSNTTVNGPWYVFSSGLSIGGTVGTTGTSAVLSNIITQPSGAITQGNNNVVLSGFKITPSASVDFTAVTATGSGTATATDLTAVRIFKDNDGNGLINGADASVSGAGISYSPGAMNFTITGESGLSAVSNYLIVANVAGVGISTVGNTVTAGIGSGAFTTTATVNSGSATGNSRNIIAPPGTSTVTAGAGAEPLTVSSLTNTQGAASLNFDFTVTDDGATPSTDNATTRISQIVFNAGTGNTVSSWSTAIAGVELSDGTNITTTATIGTTSITFSGLGTGSGSIGEVADNASKTYTLKIWLKTDQTSLKTTIDGKNFVFRVTNADLTTTSGSQLQAGQDVNSGGTNNVVDVTATALIFGVQPNAENTGVVMTPAPTVVAIDLNGNRDLSFTESIRITSTGNLAGSPVDVAAVAGVATYSTLVHNTGGIALTLKARRSISLDWDVNSSAFDITAVPVLTEVIFPQYSTYGNTSASRLPYVCRLNISNLIANSTYRYLTGGGANNAGNMIAINNTPNGSGYIVGQTSNKSLSGIAMGGDSTTSAGRYGEFTTDATGAYTGWFSIVPTGNATFAVGSTYNFLIQLNNGAGGTTVSSTLTSGISITSINPAGAVTAGGRAIRGSGPAVPENMIFLYDNIAGTGRPIAGTWAENDGFAIPSTTWYDGIVNGVSGSWGTTIPQALPNGIRRIEQRSVATGTLVGCADTTSTGIWPSGVNTVNPAGGTSPQLVITSTDAPFSCPIFNTISTGTVSGSSFCIDEFTGAAVSVPFTSTEAFGSGNIYTAQLSNAIGSFTSPINIGTLTSNSNSGIIAAEIPGNTSAGIGYRIRVISSDPSIIGSDNGSNIAITSGTSHYIDIDGDGYGDDASMVITCITPGGYINIGGDCDDFTFGINPGAMEVCGNAVDDDCDTFIDEGCTGGVTLNLNILIQGFYSGGGTMSPALFNSGASSDPSEVDSITVELYSATDLNTPFQSSAAVLKVDGTASVSFTNATLNNSYYIVVKHRNSIETWSKNPVSFSSNTTYDFIH